MIQPERGSGFDYIQHCKDVIASIDPDDLGNREIGKLVGRTVHMLGPATSVYELGSVMIGDKPYTIALKDDPEHRDRLSTELRDATILSDVVPQIVPKLPYFMGGIAIVDSKIRIGILTEDATRGSSVRIRPAHLRSETMGVIDRGFSAYRNINIWRTPLAENSAFEVDGEERILDLFPSVIDGRISFGDDTNYYTSLWDEVDEAQEAVTVWVKKDSALAQSAAEIGID